MKDILFTTHLNQQRLPYVLDSTSMHSSWTPLLLYCLSVSHWLCTPKSPLRKHNIIMSYFEKPYPNTYFGVELISVSNALGSNFSVFHAYSDWPWFLCRLQDCVAQLIKLLHDKRQVKVCKWGKPVWFEVNPSTCGLAAENMAPKIWPFLPRDPAVVNLSPLLSFIH